MAKKAYVYDGSAWVDLASSNTDLSSYSTTSQMNAAIDAAAPVGTCRAFVNFNGTGTVAIRASGNVSSITDNGTGDYTVNFTTAMPDANYVAASSGSTVTTGGVIQFEDGAIRTATAYRMRCCNAVFANIDTTYANIAFFR